MLNIQIGALPGPFFSVPKPHIIRQTPHDFLERFQSEKNDYYALKLLSFMFCTYSYSEWESVPYLTRGRLMVPRDLIWAT